MGVKGEDGGGEEGEAEEVEGQEEETQREGRRRAGGDGELGGCRGGAADVEVWGCGEHFGGLGIVVGF